MKRLIIDSRDVDLGDNKSREAFENEARKIEKMYLPEMPEGADTIKFIQMPGSCHGPIKFDVVYGKTSKGIFAPVAWNEKCFHGYFHSID